MTTRIFRRRTRIRAKGSSSSTAGCRTPTPAPAIRWFSCTAIRPRRTCGAMSSRISRRTRDASRRISSGWARRGRRRPAPIASPITRAISTRSSTALESQAQRHAGRARLGFCAGLPLGRAASRRRQGNRVHGGDRRPLQWSEWSQQAVAIFKALRSPAGDEMILKNNIFVERILPGSVIRKLSDEEMDAYRKPFIAAGRVAAPDAHVAARNSARRRTGGCRRDRRQLFEVAGTECDAEVVRQRRARRDPHRRAARVLQAMAESARGHGRRAARVLQAMAEPARGDGEGHPLHPGRFAARDRTRTRRLVQVDREK